MDKDLFDALGIPGGMLGGLIGGGLKSKLGMVDRALNYVFRLVAEAYQHDADEAADILESDERALTKVARLNELVLDGDGRDDDLLTGNSDIDVDGSGSGANTGSGSGLGVGEDED